MNLFSRDSKPNTVFLRGIFVNAGPVYVVDQLLARFVQNLVRTAAVCLSIVVVIGSSFPLFLLSIIPLGWFYLRVMKYALILSLASLLTSHQILSIYIARVKTSRRCLKESDLCLVLRVIDWRLNVMSTRLILPTPLILAFSIRSFNQQSTFIKANQRHIDRNQICYLPSISVNRWLSIRLEIVGAVIILVVAVLAMVALITTGVDAGLVGLVLSYAMNATSSLVCSGFSIFLLDFTADPIELGG